MITLGDIRTAVIRVLQDGTDIGTITGEAVQQSREYLFSPAVPDGDGRARKMLTVDIEPLSAKTAAAGLQTDRRILVRISYLEDVRTRQSDIYQVLDKIDGILRPCLRVKDRVFTVDASMGITDGIGQYTFYLDFTDAVPEQYAEPAAEKMELKFNQ